MTAGPRAKLVTAWPQATIERARAMWDEGLSTAEIGRRIDYSKNAVCGMARRQGWPQRGSPIGRTGPVKPKAPPKVPLRIRDLQARHMAREQAPARMRQDAAYASAGNAPRRAPDAAQRNPTPVPVAAKRVAVPGLAVAAVGAARTCQWIEGSTRNAVFCECTSLPGRSWCATHVRRVFVTRAVEVVLPAAEDGAGIPAALGWATA